jgi:transposase
MYLDIRFNTHKNGSKEPYGLLRESYRRNGKVLHHEKGRISGVSVEKLQQISNILKNAVPFDQERKDINSREYGAVAAILAFAESLGLDNMIFSRKEPWRNIIMATVIGRLVYQGSKLYLSHIAKDTTLWELAGYPAGEAPDVDLIYDAMDRLLERKEAICAKLVKKHIVNGSIVLYDITSSYVEGEYCEIAEYGHNRDLKKGHKQIVVGLLTTKEGCPVGVEVYKGNTADQTTVMDWVKLLKEQYQLEEMIFIGDRGMLTRARIDEVAGAGFRSITALQHKQIQSLINGEVIQLGLFDEKKIVEVIDPDNPQVRYMLCKNPIQQSKEARTRQVLIAKTEAQLAKIARSPKKRDEQAVAAQVGKWLNRWKVGKYFEWTVTDGKLCFNIKREMIEEAEDLDGCYMIRTDVTGMDKEETVRSYRQLAEVDRDFRQMKTVSLELRPIYHRLEDRVKAHVFLCMLALYIQWHMKKALRPLLANDQKGRKKPWSFDEILLRLKSLRRQDSIIADVSYVTHTHPDEEQSAILDLLQVKIV